MFYQFNPKTFKNQKSEFKGWNWLDALIWFACAIFNSIWMGLIFYDLSWWLMLISFILNFLIGSLLVAKFNSEKRVYNYLFDAILYLFTKKKFSKKEVLNFFNPLKNNHENIFEYKNLQKAYFFRIIGFNPFNLQIDDAKYQLAKIEEFFSDLNNFKIWKINGKNAIEEKINFLENIKSLANKKLIDEEIDFLKQDFANDDFNSSKWFIELKEDISKCDYLKIKFKIPIKEEINQIKKLIEFNDKINFNTNNFNYKNKIYSIWEIINLPNQLPLAFFDFLNNSKIKYKMINSKENYFKVIRKLDKYILDQKAELLNAKKESISRKINNQIEIIEKLIQDLVDEKEEIRNNKIFLFIEAIDNFNFSKIKKDFEKLFANKRIEIDFLKFKQQTALKKWVAINNIQKKENALQMSLKAFVNIFPFLETTHNDEKGLFIGSTINNNDIFFDNFKIDNQRTNMNSIIIGTSGSGKSTFVKKQIKNNFLLNHKIMVIDPEREYQKLCHNLKGNWINFSTEKSKNKINPLEVFGDKELSEHLLFLEGWFKTLFDLKIEHISILKNCLINLYIKNQKPIMQDLVEEINKQKNQSDKGTIKNKAFQFLEIVFSIFNDQNSPETKLWGSKTNIDLNNQFNVFDIQTLQASGNEKIIKAQMLIILQLFQSEMIKNKAINNKKAFFVVDEAHLIIDDNNPVGLNFLYQLFKRARKYHTSINAITQNINDFVVGSEQIKKKTTAIINNAQYQFIFKLKEGDINDLNNLFSSSNNVLTEQEVNQLPYFERGEVLFGSSGNIRKYFKIIITKKEEKLWE